VGRALAEGISKKIAEVGGVYPIVGRNRLDGLVPWSPNGQGFRAGRGRAARRAGCRGDSRAPGVTAGLRQGGFGEGFGRVGWWVGARTRSRGRGLL
jgi:hypothetical protein